LRRLLSQWVTWSDELTSQWRGTLCITLTVHCWLPTTSITTPTKVTLQCWEVFIRSGTDLIYRYWYLILILFVVVGAILFKKPDGSTFLHEMTSCPPSLNYDVESKIRLRQLNESMRIYVKNKSPKFHPDPIWNDGALCFFAEVAQQEEEEEEQQQQQQQLYRVRQIKVIPCRVLLISQQRIGIFTRKFTRLFIIHTYV